MDEIDICQIIWLHLCWDEARIYQRSSIVEMHICQSMWPHLCWDEMAMLEHVASPVYESDGYLSGHVASPVLG